MYVISLLEQILQWRHSNHEHLPFFRHYFGIILAFFQQFLDIFKLRIAIFSFKVHDKWLQLFTILSIFMYISISDNVIG